MPKYEKIDPATTELVLKQDTRICNKCGQNVGRSRWAVGHPLFRMLCQSCWEPIRHRMLNPVKAVETCDVA